MFPLSPVTSSASEVSVDQGSQTQRQRSRRRPGGPGHHYRQDGLLHQVGQENLLDAPVRYDELGREAAEDHPSVADSLVDPLVEAVTTSHLANVHPAGDLVLLKILSQSYNLQL